MKVPGRSRWEDGDAEERVVEQELALRLQQAQAELRRANLEIDDMRTRWVLGHAIRLDVGRFSNDVFPTP